MLGLLALLWLARPKFECWMDAIASHCDIWWAFIVFGVWRALADAWNIETEREKLRSVSVVQLDEETTVWRKSLKNEETKSIYQGISHAQMGKLLTRLTASLARSLLGEWTHRTQKCVAFQWASVQWTLEQMETAPTACRPKNNDIRRRAYTLTHVTLHKAASHLSDCVTSFFWLDSAWCIAHQSTSEY